MSVCDATPSIAHPLYIPTNNLNDILYYVAKLFFKEIPLYLFLVPSL